MAGALVVLRDNKLFQIKPTLGEWPPGFRRSRKEEVVLSRLRIGHTYFSHSYILRREDPPECTSCQDIYSVRHVLIDCIDLGLIRPRFYSVRDMKTLFDTVSVDRIIDLVRVTSRPVRFVYAAILGITLWGSQHSDMAYIQIKLYSVALCCNYECHSEQYIFHK